MDILDEADLILQQARIDGDDIDNMALPSEEEMLNLVLSGINAKGLSAAEVNNKLLDLHHRVRRNYPEFSKLFLKIKLEGGGVGSFLMNDVQWRTHIQFEKRIAEIGYLRAIILKSRRDGLSTYIAGRFYHKMIYNYGFDVFIQAHKISATDTLFNMVKMFHRFMPDVIRPNSSVDSAKSLKFEGLEASYSLSTAGSKDGARSQGAVMAHCSETALWRDAEDNVSNISSIVPVKAGTELIHESTGIAGSHFEEMWYRAVKDGVFLPIFHPWYKSARNRMSAEGLILLPEEKELMSMYAGMTEENIAFRRHQLGSMAEEKFYREFPSTPEEAFSASIEGSFISPELARKAAMRNVMTNVMAPRVLGVDPSQTLNGDAGGMAVRQGNKVIGMAEFRRETLPERVSAVISYATRYNVDHIFIDQGGSGKEIAEMMRTLGWKNITVIPFKMQATNKEMYVNKRNEIYNEMRNWLEEGGDIPNDPSFIRELALTKYTINMHGQEVLESKSKMSESPNLADALALTFAFPVMSAEARNSGNRYGIKRYA